MEPGEILDHIERVFNLQLFVINQTPITPASILMFLLVIAVFSIVSRILCGVMFRRVLARFRLDMGTQYNLTRVAHYLVMLIGMIVAFQFVGVDLSGLAVIFGLLSVGIGFGLQNVTSNFVSGLIILFERPIKVGDRITVNDVQGDVVEINMRATTIRSLNNIFIIVPNSDFVTSAVTNWSHRDPKVRLDIGVGVSYGSDLDAVLRCLREVAEECHEVLKNPPPEVLHLGFGDSSWNMQLRVWISDPKRYFVVTSDLNCAIVRKFRANGVEIPFPQRDLHVRSPLPVPLSQESGAEARS